MKVPIYYENSICGELRMETEGLYTRFTADCELKPGILRLWIGESSLGVMMPQSGRLRLSKRLSRLEMSRLPGSIESALLAIKPEAPKKAAEKPAEPVPEPWTALPDGSLYRDGYVALPCMLRNKPYGLHIEQIDGREYLIFRY